MNIPMIDLVSAAGFETAAAVLSGAVQSSAMPNAVYDDGVVSVMVYVYDVLPQTPLM